MSDPDDTPRDPLAALIYPNDLFGMDPFLAYRWGFSAAMALVREHDATRPSGDEALRAAAKALLDLDQSDDWSLDTEADAKAVLRAALAAPVSPSPDGSAYAIGARDGYTGAWLTAAIVAALVGVVVVVWRLVR